MRRFSRGWVTASLFAALAASVPAAAAPELTWDAPKGCPRGAAVLELVRDIVGEDVWGGATLHASGRIVETPNGYRLDLRMADASETRVRTLDAKVCADLLGASAVVLGLNLKSAANGDGMNAAGEAAAGAAPTAVSTAAAGQSTAPTEGVTAATPAAPQSPATASSAATAPNESDTSAANAPAARERGGIDRFWLGLPRVAIGLGSLPRVTWSAGATFGVRFSEWATWLSARYQLPQVIHSEWSTEVGVEIARYSAEVGVSRGWRTGLLELGPQVFVAVDYLTARGEGAELVGATAGAVVPAVGAGAFARVSLGTWVSLSGTLCGEVPLSRPRFVVDSLGDVGQLGVAQGRFDIGVDWKF